MVANLIFGQTYHCRFEPEKHDFSYPVFMLDTDLATLDQLNSSWLTGYNKKRLLAVFDEDYLHQTFSIIIKNLMNKL